MTQPLIFQYTFGTTTVILVEQGGKITDTHYAESMIAELPNKEPLSVLAKLSF